MLYTMCTTIVGFYLPAAIVSGIYFKLYMIFRGRVRTRVDREVKFMKKVDEMDFTEREAATLQPQISTEMIKRLVTYSFTGLLRRIQHQKWSETKPAKQLA